MTKDNVIHFPKMKLNTPPQSLEELAEKLIEYKRSYADEIAEILWNNLLAEMARSGCDFGNDMSRYYPSMVLILEAIRSLHLQLNDIEHPLQKFAQETISFEESVDIKNELE